MLTSRRGFLKFLLGSAVVAAGSTVYSFPSILRPQNLWTNPWTPQLDEVTRLYHAGDLDVVSFSWVPLPWVEEEVINCRCVMLPVDPLALAPTMGV